MFRNPLLYLIIGNILAAVLFYFLIFAGSAEPQELRLSISLKQADQCGVKALLNGLIETGYDSNQNGIADLFTLHRLAADGLPQPHPLFYGTDKNEDGSWETIYRDIEEDGINGNEEEYWNFLPAGK